MTDIQKDIVVRMKDGWTLIEDIEVTSQANVYLEHGTRRYAVHRKTFNTMREKAFIALAGKPAPSIKGRRSVWELTDHAIRVFDAINGVGGEA